MDSNQNEQESWQQKESQGEQALDAPISFLPSVLYQLGLDREQADVGGSINEQLAALHDSDWRVRVSALRTLEAWGTHVPQVELVQALDDEDDAVRAAAVHALGMLREQAPVERLVSALQDSNWHVRETAVLALGNLGARVPERSLVLAMKDSDSMVREAAGLVLHQRHSVVVSAVEPEESRNPHEAQTTYSIIMEDSDLVEAHADKYVQFSQADTLQRWEPPRKRGFLRSHLVIIVICAVLLIGAVNVTAWLGFVYNMHLSLSSISVVAGKVTPMPVPPSLDTPVYTYYRQSSPISSVAWSPNDTRIASVSGDVEVWDAFTGQRIFKWSAPQNRISTVAWAPNGKYIAVSGSSSYLGAPVNIYVLDANNGQIVSTGHTIAPQASEAHIGALQATSGGGSDPVYSLAWSPDSMYVAAADYGIMQIFNAMTGADAGTSGMSASIDNSISSVSWSPDGQYIAYGWGSQLMLWNVATRKLQVHLPGITNDLITSVAWSPDSQYLAIGVLQIGITTANFTAEIWDPLTKVDSFIHDRAVGTWSPGGIYIAGIYVDPHAGEVIQIWDSMNGGIFFTYTDKVAQINCINCITWSPDGNFIASGDSVGNINIWRAG